MNKEYDYYIMIRVIYCIMNVDYLRSLLKEMNQDTKKYKLLKKEEEELLTKMNNFLGVCIKSSLNKFTESANYLEQKEKADRENILVRQKHPWLSYEAILKWRYSAINYDMSFMEYSNMVLAEKQHSSEVLKDLSITKKAKNKV